MIKFFFLAFILICITTIGSKTVQAQKYREIIPLISTCKDIKKILDVQECKYPYSNYEFTDFGITINFSTEENQWKIEKGIVTEAIIVLKKAIKLQEFEKNLTDYKIVPDEDLPDIKLYINDKLGIRLTVEVFSNEKYVTSIYLYPSKKMKSIKTLNQKLSCG